MEAIAAIFIAIIIMLGTTEKDSTAAVKTQDGTELECRID